MWMYPRVDQVDVTITIIMMTAGEVEKQRLCEVLILALREFSSYTWQKGMRQVSQKDEVNWEKPIQTFQEDVDG